MKHLLAFVFSIIILSADNKSSDYDTSYCHDKTELARWQMLNLKHPKDHNIQTLHALWIGLCQKVEKKEITTNMAQEIFEKARSSVIFFINEINKAKEHGI